MNSTKTVRSLLHKAALGLLVLLAAAPFLTLRGYSSDNQNSCLAMNQAGICSWGKDFMFVDCFKVARGWISQQNGQPWGGGPALSVDSEGWVTALQDGTCYAETVMLDGVAERPAGTYTVYYEGTGTLTFSGDVTATVPNGPGSYLLTVSGTQHNGIWMQIRATNPPPNHIRHIKIIMPGFESTYQTQPFHPTFINQWKKFRAYRFMDWMATNGSTLVNWADRSTLSTHAHWGVQLEYINQYCNQQQADAWINIPHQASNEFIKKFAILLRSGYDMGAVDVSGTEGVNWFLNQGTQVCAPLDPTLKIYIEYSNECWNGIFSQTGYVQTQGVARYPAYAATPWEAGPLYYADRSLEIFDLFDDVFGGTSRLVRLLAWQTGYNFNTMFDHTYSTYGATYLHTDAIATAPYFGGHLDDGYDDDNNYIGNYTTDQILDICDVHIPEIMSTIRSERASAYARINSNGQHITLLDYEAGQHLVGVGGMENDTVLEALFKGTNRTARMKDTYIHYLTQWRDSGGNLMAIFSSMGDYSKWGSWGVLENYSEDPMTKPKWKALMQFMDTNNVWWEQTPPAPPPVGTQIINFQGTALPAGITLNRTFANIGSPVTGKRVDFSTANGGNIYNCPGYNQGGFYGGFTIDYAPYELLTKPCSMSLSDASDNFSSSADGGNPNGYSKIAACFMWRKDQFLQPSATTVGKLSVNIQSGGWGDFRFVVRNGSTYYISSLPNYSTGTFELAEFNNSSLDGKMWKVWTPAATNFDIPDPLLGFSPMSFNDVQEVGFAYTGERGAWGHSFNFNTFQAWAMDPAEFTCVINRDAAQADPTSVSPVNFKVVFNKATSNFATGDVTIGGPANPTTQLVTQIAPMNGTTYNVAVSGMNLTGNVTATVAAGVCTDGSNPNRASTSLQNFVYYVAPNPPTCTVNQAAGQYDPTNSTPINFTVVFNEAVTGFANGEVTITGTAGATTSVVSGGGATYNVAVSGMAGNGTVIVNVPAGVANNGLGTGNLASTSTDNTVTYDTSNPPEVAINQAAGQADPSSNMPVNFTAVFSTPVSGFDSGDVTLGGTAGATIGAITEASPFDDTTYNVAASGMTATGTVTATIAAGVCQNKATGALNHASTSADNTVNYVSGSALAGTLVNFLGTNVPSPDPGLNRAFVPTGSSIKTITFSTATGDHIFSTTDTQARFYGGAKYDTTPKAIGTDPSFQLRTNDADYAPNRFLSYIGITGVGEPSKCDLNLIWRKDQFLNGLSAQTVGFDNNTTNSYLTININTISGDAPDLRFVIKNGSTYYLSEWTTNSTGTKTLNAFNNSGTAGKRWGVFTPTANSFGIPTTLPTFNAVNFNDVQEIGFVYKGYRAAYGNGFEYNQYTASGIAIMSAPTLQFGQASYVVDESSGTVQATIYVTRTGDSTPAVGVTYATSPGTALAGVDYTTAGGALSWTAGDKNPKSFTVGILSDPAAESAKSLNLTLSSPTGGASLGSPNPATLTINDWVGASGPAPTITVTVSGSNLLLGFPTVNGKTYRLLQNSNTPQPGAAGWSYAGQQLTGNGATQSFTVAKPAAGKVFYTVEYTQ